MGIETAIMAIGAAASAASAIKSLTTKAPKVQAPEVQPLTQADKPPAAAKTPERPAISKANVAAAGPGGTMAGNSGTFLTGPSGVDSSTLNLGKHTLLGQ
jgi:hypothetical protein